GKSLGKAVFWVLWLVFIMMGLSRFPQLAEPLQGIKDMLNRIFSYVPQIIGAGFIFFIGWVLARIFREAATSTLEAAQVDNLVAKLGSETDSGVGSRAISKTLGTLLYAFVLFVFSLAALSVLKIESISAPLTDMLHKITDYIPQVFAASVVMALFVLVAKFVSNLIKSTLPALGVDNSLSALTALGGNGGKQIVPSKIIAMITFIGIVLTGLSTAVSILKIDQLTSVFSTLLHLGGSITMGGVIIGAGLFIASVLSKIFGETSGPLAARIIKYATIVLFTFMGLNYMGIGQEIVDTAFKYALGAVAFAAGVGGALAFGFGGRDWAKAKLAKWFPTTASRAKKK
ncbi:MAG TPA: hypothetical protein ENK01_03660, partial [Hellea balneolensis]|nr:hypothetical protein [Hellea balneolensis]